MNNLSCLLVLFLLNPLLLAAPTRDRGGVTHPDPLLPEAIFPVLAVRAQDQAMICTTDDCLCVVDPSTGHQKCDDSNPGGGGGLGDIGRVKS